MTKRLLAGIALALLIASPVAAGTKGRHHAPLAPSSITLDQSGPFVIGDAVTFTSSANGLVGSEYPMVYLRCEVSGRTVYGQLDYPATVFVIGGGSSPWIDPADPDYLAPATCVGELRAYGDPFTSGTIRILAETPPFAVG